MPAMFMYFAADQPYVPQPADEGNGVLEFFTSAQTILGLVAALLALTMLLWSLRPGRGAREDGEEREGKGRT